MGRVIVINIRPIIGSELVAVSDGKEITFSRSEWWRQTSMIETSLAFGLTFERRNLQIAFDSADRKEGWRPFSKRESQFQGRLEDFQ